jgi:hypothetical protein
VDRGARLAPVSESAVAQSAAMHTNRLGCMAFL